MEGTVQNEEGKPGLEKEVDGDESWRKVKKLGSLLGDAEDMERRKLLATTQFKKMRCLWKHNGAVSEQVRLRLNNALVLPVLMYNAGTWGLTGIETERFEYFP